MASLAVHTLLVLVATYWGDFQLLVSKQDETMEIVFNERSNEQIFVASEPTQEEPKQKPEKEVKFKSSQTQRTELETWKRPTQKQDFSTNILLENGGQGGEEDKEPMSEQEQETFADGDYYTEDNRKPLKLPGYGSRDTRPTVPNYIQETLPPGVRLGNITSLNTDQHRYYSFNNRLLSRFVPLWGRQVRQALFQWLNENNSPGISKVWVTNVEIIMDASGEIIDVQPFRLSGLWPIDQAAIDSFKKVRQVPNPPKELVDENGYIHLQFQTEVYWVPQPGVRYHGGGPGQ